MNSTTFASEEAVQQVNDSVSLFWIVSCSLPLHVECFMPIVVGVEDNQTMWSKTRFSISFNVALCAFVLGCVCACVIG